MTSNSKHALLEVPNFAKDKNGTSLTSYLRLGTVAKQVRAADLLSFDHLYPSNADRRTIQELQEAYEVPPQ